MAQVYGHVSGAYDMKKQIIETLAGGWEPSTYYVVEVCMNSGNPIFQDIFYSGFLTDNGYPNGYNRLFDSEREIKDVLYLRAIRKIDKNITNQSKMISDVYPEYYI